MERVWNTPDGEYSRLYHSMLSEVHLLIAGATGSGKSTAENGIINAALYDSPAKRRFILVDPKGCELDMYSCLPHCIAYAQTEEEIISAFKYTLDIINTRLHEMKRRKERIYHGSDIYVIIDELMVIMVRKELRKEVFPILQEILAIARASRVHVIACTQSPIAKVIPTELKCNFDSRLALRTACAQDSRNIIGRSCCEHFPKPSLAHKAYGAYMQGADLNIYQLTQVPEHEINRLIDYWIKHKKPKLTLFKR